MHLCKPLLEESFGENFADEDQLRKVLAVVQARMKTVTDVVDLTSYFWQDEITYTPEAIDKLTKEPEVINILRSLQDNFSMLKFFTQEELEQACARLISDLGIKFGVVAHPLRSAVCGRTASSGIFETLALLGKEKVLKRIGNAIQFIEQKKI